MKPFLILISLAFIGLIGCSTPAPDVGYKTIAGDYNCTENSAGYRAAYQEKFGGWNKTLLMTIKGKPRGHAVAVFQHADGVYVYDDDAQRSTWKLSSNPFERRPMILARAWEFEKFALSQSDNPPYVTSAGFF